MSQVYFFLEVEVKDGQLDALESLMKELVANAKDHEPGTLNYEWSKNAAGTIYHIYERYADSAALMTHLTAFGIPQDGFSSHVRRND